MSVVKPNVDEVLRPVDYDRFLACSVTSSRASEINQMRFDQRGRALLRDSGYEVAKKSGRNSVSIAFEEMSDGKISHVPNTINAAMH